MSAGREQRLDPAALERLARAAREAASPADVLARYRIERELGRGAMGVVVEARDLDLDRPVALKLLARAAELSPDARARFLREARAAARLTHPSIAAVYDANEAFIAMQLVDGKDLAVQPVRDPRVLATLVRDAALAVHYAHSQGIVHRDLKPANLMATSDVPPRVVVTDFGLAKELELAQDLSHSGSIVGTPAFMAPEQAAGAGGTVDARTDVYGLGATLYDQLAGRPPFAGDALLDVLRRVVEEDPPPLARGVDRDLAMIVHKCLAKAPEQRYASALALAGDLDRWLSGETVLARPPSLAYRARRFLARRQGVLAAAAGAAVVAVLLVSPFWLRARERRASAERALVLAETVDRALELDPSLTEARFERGIARGVLVREQTRPREEFPPEMEALRAAAIEDLSAGPGSEDLLTSLDRTWGLALLAWLHGDRVLADRLCQDVIELDPAHVEARLVLARIATEEGDTARAMFLTAEAIDVMGGMGQVYRSRLQVGSAAIEPSWTRLQGRREILLDLRKAASVTPTVTFASGALALEGLEAGARSLAAGDVAAALHELETAEAHLTRALDAADADPVLLAARGVCGLLRDEAFSSARRVEDAARAREACARDLGTASRLGTTEVRVTAWWNQSLLEERRMRIALLEGDAAAAETARAAASTHRDRALAAAIPGSGLAALLVEHAGEN